MAAFKKGHKPSDASRAKMRQSAMGNTNANAMLREWHERHRIHFDSDMLRTLIVGYFAGRHYDFLAAEIGVCQETLRKEARRLGLPNRRHKVPLPAITEVLAKALS